MTAMAVASDARRGPSTQGPIRISVRTPAQLLNSIDPSPFVERDRDDAAERFIVTWARELPARAPLALQVRVAEPPASLEDNAGAIRDAVGRHFAASAETASRELAALLRRGRTSLAIGVVFLAACLLAADQVAHLAGTRFAEIAREGLTVAGWVAMWRPMEIFLYGWWPLVGERRLYRRLAAMPVEVVV